MKFLIIGLLSLSSFASFKMTCETPRQNVKLKINGNSLTLSGRNPAQVKVQRTRYSGKSITKIFYINGSKHTVFLNNAYSPDQLEDHLTIKSRQGHEMTYPMNCKLL